MDGRLAFVADEAIRVDKWLWAARFYKTRSLAQDAVAGGKVKVNGERVKAAKAVRVGDELRLQLGPYEHVVQVRALSDRRGPALQAALLYEESAESRSARAALALHLAATKVAYPRGEGRPTKKARRQLIDLKKRF